MYDNIVLKSDFQFINIFPKNSLIMYDFQAARVVLSLKAMDQIGHVTKFLLYGYFSLCNPISIKNKIHI